MADLNIIKIKAFSFGYQQQAKTKILSFIMPTSNINNLFYEPQFILIGSLRHNILIIANTSAFTVLINLLKLLVFGYEFNAQSFYYERLILTTSSVIKMYSKKNRHFVSAD